MRSTEIRNATLTSVSGQKGEDDWSTPALAPAPIFSGLGVGVLYDERVVRRTGRSAPSNHVARTLSVRDELGIPWRVGLVVVILPDSPPAAAPFTATVTAVEAPLGPRGEGGEVVLTLDRVA